MRKLAIAALAAALLAPSAFAQEAKSLNPCSGDDTAAKHLSCLKGVFKEKYPAHKPEDYALGAIALDKGSQETYEFWMGRFADDFDRPDEHKKAWETGKRLFEAPLKSGKTYAQCLPGGGKGLAASYPRFDETAKKVATLEMDVNACRVANGEAPYAYDDKKEFWPLMLYVRSLSDGHKVAVKDPKTPEAIEAFNKGKDLFYNRQGKLGFSCSSCHVGASGMVLRSETLSPALGQASHWPAFRPNKEGAVEMWTLQRRYQRCQQQIQAPDAKIGSEEFNNLEYFHTYISNGIPMKAGAFRK